MSVFVDGVKRTEFTPGDVASPGIFPAGDPDTGLFSANPDELSASTGGSEIVRRTATQNLFGTAGGEATPDIAFIGDDWNYLKSAMEDQLTKIHNMISRQVMPFFEAVEKAKEEKA